MPATAQQDAWVTRVLHVTRPALATASAGPGTGSGVDAPNAPLNPPVPNGSASGDQPTEGFFDTLQDIATDLKAAFTGTDPRKTGKADLLAQMAKLVDPPGATDDNKKAFKKQRDAVEAALQSEAPPQPQLDAAAAALATLASLVSAVKRESAVKALEAKDPDAARDARAAFAAFGKELGTTEVTPALVGGARDARASKEKELTEAAIQLKKAKALPDTDARKAALVKRGTDNYGKLKAEADKLVARENALVGMSSLQAALTTGPLAPDAVTPFKPETARKLIAAYGQDARMADAAVTTAAKAKYPDAVADQIGPMIDKAKNGFAAANGENFPDRDTAKKYGQDLLQMGGDLGPAYFARLNDYVASGQQFVAGATGESNPSSFPQLQKQRTVKLAGTLLKPDGSLDLSSDAAKAGIGNQLFHPDAMLNKCPALANQVMSSVEFLSDPAHAGAADTVLKGVTAPTSPVAQTLVRGALGTGPTAALDDTATRTAVLAAFLKPLDQGPVGSCFTTAPSRRLRETQPLDAMKAYADLANRGVYKPASGPEFPAVTNLPADDDQLLRSFEYSVAAAAGRQAGSIEQRNFGASASRGAEELKTVAMKHDASADPAAAWATKKSKLANDVAAAFTFTYDPTAEIPASNDGHSSRGRYVVQRVSDNKEIRSQVDYTDAIYYVALASLGIADGTPEAAEVKTAVTSQAFITKVTQGKYLPWALPGGGFGAEAEKTIHGGNPTAQAMLTPAPTSPKPTEGARTKDVLTSLLKTFRGNPGKMATIETAGQHSFNALPNDPSFLELQGTDDADTAQKMQTKLLDKGQALKNADIPADRAAATFDEAIAREAKAEADPDLKRLIETEAARVRPTGAMKPPALATAIDQALDAYHERIATKRTDKWSADRVTAGTPTTPQEIADKKAAEKKGLNDGALNGARDKMMKDMGAPNFTIADTNWGGPTNHVFFVIAPDPVTGDPMMFKRTEPGGAMVPAGRDWVDRQWQVVK